MLNMPITMVAGCVGLSRDVHIRLRHIVQSHARLSENELQLRERSGCFKYDWCCRGLALNSRVINYISPLL